MARVPIKDISDAFELLFDSLADRDFKKTTAFEKWTERKFLLPIRFFLLGWFLPIRLSPTPTICSVSPWTAGKGRRRRIEEAIRLILDCSENRTGV